MGCNASKTDTPNNNSKKHTKTETPDQPVNHSASSPKPQKSSNDDIAITLDNDESNPDVKMLLLGSGESGKSTIWRQLKLIYCGGFPQDEREGMASVVKLNLVADIKQLVEAVQDSGQSVADLQSYFEDILNLDTEEDLTVEVAHEIKALWDDPTLKTTYKKSNSIGLGDNASFFLDSAERIAKTDYIPTDEDLLKSRIRTTGISSIHFKINNKIRTQLVDVGGQKCERAKWEKCFKGVQYVIFVISLSDFDQFMFEDDTIRRTQDSIDLFKSVANSQVFANKPIFIVFNKKDLFERKLKEYPSEFKETYPDFKGDINNVEQCIEHVKERFLSQLLPDRNKETAWVESIPLCAMDTNSVRNLFQTISKKIMSSRS